MKRYLTLMMAIFLVISVATGCSKADNNAAAATEKEKIIAVEIEKPEKGSISQSVTMSGKLEPVNSVTVIPEINGMAKIKDLKVKLGDIVKEGDVLFTIDNEKVQDQIENLRLSYETAKKNYNKAKESIENAKLNLERSEQLYKEGAISEQQLEQAKLAASDLQLDVLESQLEQAKFAYTNGLEQLEDAVVTAPIGGYISSVNVEEKGMVTAQPSLIITDISKLEVEISVTEGLVNRIKKDQEIKIEIPAIEETVKGIVTVINPVPDQVTQLYKGKINLDNQNKLLRPGMFAKIFINMDEKNSAITIPSVAVIQEEDKFYIYVVEENKPVKKYVEIGMDNGEIVEVISGISKDDKIIVKGQDFITEGSKVKVVRGEN